MQVAGHVRRRMRNRKALARIVGLGVVEAFGLPRLLPALLDPVRVVQRLHQGIVVLPTFRVRGRESGESGSDYALSMTALRRSSQGRRRRKLDAVSLPTTT